MLTCFADHFATGPYATNVVEQRSLAPAGAQMFRFRQPAGRFPDPPTSDFVLASIAESPRGSGLTEIDLGAGRWRDHCRPGLLTLAPPATAADYVVDRPHGGFIISISAIRVGELLAGETVDGNHDFGRLHASGFEDNMVSVILERLWSEAARGEAAGTLAVQSAVLTIFANLSALAKRGAPHSTPVAGGLPPFRLRRALEYIDDNLSLNVSLTSLAREVGLSPRHFCTAFKRSTGVPPHRFLMQRRLDRAKELVLSGMSIAEAAHASGFASQQHLTTAFRTNLGATPAAWRRDRLF